MNERDTSGQSGIELKVVDIEEIDQMLPGWQRSIAYGVVETPDGVKEYPKGWKYLRNAGGVEWSLSLISWEEGSRVGVHLQPNGDYSEEAHISTNGLSDSLEIDKDSGTLTFSGFYGKHIISEGGMVHRIERSRPSAYKKPLVEDVDLRKNRSRVSAQLA